MPMERKLMGVVLVVCVVAFWFVVGVSIWTVVEALS